MKLEFCWRKKCSRAQRNIARGVYEGYHDVGRTYLETRIEELKICNSFTGELVAEVASKCKDA